MPFEVENMRRLMGYANENMGDFVRGMRSEVCCNCDTAAAWKEGLEKGKQESCQRV